MKFVLDKTQTKYETKHPEGEETSYGSYKFSLKNDEGKVVASVEVATLNPYDFWYLQQGQTYDVIFSLVQPDYGQAETGGAIQAQVGQADYNKVEAQKAANFYPSILQNLKERNRSQAEDVLIPKTKLSAADIIKLVEVKIINEKQAKNILFE